MTIYQSIYKAVYEYKYAHDFESPKAIYLGYEELGELRASDEMKTHCITDYKTGKAEIFGVRIYEVKEKNHFAVA